MDGVLIHVSTAVFSALGGAAGLAAILGALGKLGGKSKGATRCESCPLVKSLEQRVAKIEVEKAADDSRTEAELKSIGRSLDEIRGQQSEIFKMLVQLIGEHGK